MFLPTLPVARQCFWDAQSNVWNVSSLSAFCTDLASWCFLIIKAVSLWISSLCQGDVGSSLLLTLMMCHRLCPGSFRGRQGKAHPEHRVHKLSCADAKTVPSLAWHRICEVHLHCFPVIAK